MALNNAALDIAGNALADAIKFLAIHTGDPGTTGANQSGAPRQPVTWTVSNGGDLHAEDISFTGGEPGGPATHVGYWSAATGGTFYGSQPLVGDSTFNAAGEYDIDSVDEIGTAGP
jgi:hypothetical protein